MTKESSVTRRVRVDAPAKLNLGLEVLGRRADGFHEIRTILQTIGLTDRIALVPAQTLEIESDDHELANETNLALKALSLLQARSAGTDGARLILEKGIPVAAGLGGASSDAAAALLGGRALWELPTSTSTLHELASSLGSDVPFFLRGKTTMAGGRGYELEDVPTPASVWFVLVSPHLVLPRKTASLYAALQPMDFSDGGSVEKQRERLRNGCSLDPELLGNAFSRPLSTLMPALAELPSLMHRHGAPNVSLSGAGPAHYVVLDDPEKAARLARTLDGALGSWARVVAVPTHATGPRIIVETA